MRYHGRRPSIIPRRGMTTRGRVGVAVAGLGAFALVVGSYIVEHDVDDDVSDDTYANTYVSDDSDSIDAAMVCTSPDDLTRVDDTLCGDYTDDGSTIFAGGYHYMFFDARTYKGDVPAVGQKMPVGKPAGVVRTYMMDSTKVVSKAPTTGGKTSTIQRGGFGVPNANSGTKSGTSAGTSGGTKSGGG